MFFYWSHFDLGTNSHYLATVNYDLCLNLTNLLVSPLPLPPPYCYSLRQTNGVSNCLTMTDVCVKTCYKMFFDQFWTHKYRLLSRSIQVGLKYTMEGYIKILK